MKNISHIFDKNGIITFHQCLNKTKLQNFYETLLNICYFHLQKIGDHHKLVNKLYKGNMPIGDKISKILEIFEDKDKESLYQLQKLFSSNNDLRNILDTKMLNKSFRKLLKIDENVPLLTSGPGIFINRPKTKRLLYKWHAESHYYPKRRNFLNIWFPIFYNKSEKNGTMLVKEKSHLLMDLPFNEYTGYNKNTEGKKNHFTQYEIPENFVKDLKTFKANLKVRDILVFNRKSVHASTENLSKKYSFAVVFRIWEMSKDLTMSGDLDVSPYRDSGNGRSNLKVDV